MSNSLPPEKSVEKPTQPLFDPKAARKQDHFLTGLQNVFSKILSHPKLLRIVLISFAVVSVALLVGLTQREKRIQQGQKMLFEAQKSLQDEVEVLKKADAPAPQPEAANKKAPSPPPAPQGMVEYRKLDVNASFPKSVEAFKATAKQYKGSVVGFLAAVQLANLYLDHGQSALAREWFENAKGSASSAMERTVAIQGIGMTHENEGKYGPATEAYQSALNQGDPALRGNLLLAMGRLQELQGQKEGAKKTYEKIISDLPNSAEAREAEQLKKRLN